jgi:histidinol-phosphatase (PHP family)
LDYVKEAVIQGFDTLGFSDHAPVLFKNTFAIRDGKLEEYVNTILDLRKQYSSPHILLALEVDYIPGITMSFDDLRKQYPFDYLIGSVHLVNPSPCPLPQDGGGSEQLWFIDGPDISIYDKGLQELFGGDGRKAVTAYYRQVQEMIITQKPDIIGHLDKIKMYNRGRYFQETDPWYVNLVDETLDLIRDSGCVIEVNTRGIYKKRSEALFPGLEILKKIHALKIPVTISSDAHKPHELSLYFSETREILAKIGFKGTWMKSREAWKEIPFN